MKPVIEQAFRVASRDLARCVGDEGIRAGLNHFNEYWSWDGFFAGMGAVKIGLSDAVRKNLQLFIDNISDDGQVPYRIGSNHGVVLKKLGLRDRGRVKPQYKLHDMYFWGTSKKRVAATTKVANCMLLTAIGDYVEVTKDQDFLERNQKKIARISEWLVSQEREGLIYESWHENWADSLRTQGYGLFTNVCYWQGLAGLGHLDKANHLKKLIVDRFWTGEYLAGWDSDKSFLTDGNMLAAWWGVVDKGKAGKIIDYYKKRDRGESVPAGLRWEDPDKGLIPNRFKALGVADYHGRSVAWLWLGAITALACRKYDLKYAKEIIERMAKVIVDGGEVFEIYELSGKPVRRRWYKAEHPFAWNAGMFTRACIDVWPSLGRL